MNKVIFDLDKTIWNCYRPDGEQIWAKQLTPPFYRVSPNVVEDSKSNKCILQPGFCYVLTTLHEKNVELGYLSVGAQLNLDQSNQPSVILLKLFDLYSFFNAEKWLLWKSASKADRLKTLGNCTFVDDDNKHIKATAELKHVKTIDRKTFISWENFDFGDFL
jgi:predicted phosphatase